jgi:ubiquinone/menaquinone biosynthesis C-methylase UbiE
MMMVAGSGVFDIAGGRGNVSFELLVRNGIPSTLVDPRPQKLEKLQHRSVWKRSIVISMLFIDR